METINDDTIYMVDTNEIRLFIRNSTLTINGHSINGDYMAVRELHQVNHCEHCSLFNASTKQCIVAKMDLKCRSYNRMHNESGLDISWLKINMSQEEIDNLFKYLNQSIKK